VLTVSECVIANNSEPELSQKLAQYLLSAEAQAKALDKGNIVPSNVKTHAGTAGGEEKLTAFQTYMSNARVVDWDAINKNRPEWNNRWNRKIER
jgi:putative spermidine/putrescine transport system substrate-binding protein